MTVGLVLGAGGLVGIAHHVGVLRALEREAGFAPDGADLIVGTSAGSAVAAYVRNGWSSDQLYERVRNLSAAAPAPAAGSPIELGRRILGSAYVVARSGVPVPPKLWPRVPHFLRKAFPAGLVTMGHGPRLLETELPGNWPARALWVCALDIETGERVVLGRKGSPEVPLARAVQASCAIPGVYRPVRVGASVLVDGGAYSLMNVDLAVAFGCDVIICVAPLAFDPANSRAGLHRGLRLVPSMALRREVDAARRAGKRVVVLAPGHAELRAHGCNLMRATGLEEVALASYDATARAVAGGKLAGILPGLAA